MYQELKEGKQILIDTCSELEKVTKNSQLLTRWKKIRKRFLPIEIGSEDFSMKKDHDTKSRTEKEDDEGKSKLKF